MWKDKFVELLFSNNQMKINAMKAARLKYENFPSFLYKYRKFDENGNSVKSLKENKILLSNPFKFNDPYDSAFMLKEPLYMQDHHVKKSIEDDPVGFKEAYDVTRKQIAKIKRSNNPITVLSRCIAKNRFPEYKNNKKKLREISKEIEQEIREINADVSKLKENFLVSCFSEDYKSILMWSHYAEEHTGFCVKYDFKSLGYNNHLTRFLYPIIYSNKIFTIDDYVYDTDRRFKSVISDYMKGIDLNKVIDGLQIGILEKNSNLLNDMFQVFTALNKYNGWEYEKEWRYVLYCQIEIESAYIKIPKPTAIYLGAKSKEEDKESILEIGKEKNIDIYQMEMKSSKFALEPKKLQ